MKHFFITGFPRTRTAWLANLFTHGDSICLHEGFGPDGWKYHLTTDSDVKYFGDSSSGLFPHIEFLTSTYPAAPWVIVDRRREEAEKSYFDWSFSDPHPNIPRTKEDITKMFDLCEHGLREVLRLAKHREIVSFDALDDMATLKWMHRYLTPENRFDEQRAEMLQTMRINQIASKIPVIGGLAWAQ